MNFGACANLSSRYLGKIGADIAVLSCFPGTISTSRGTQLCSIIGKMHLCTCARLSSRSLFKIGAEIAVFLGTISNARRKQHCSIFRKRHLCACARLSTRSLGKIGADIAVLSWNQFYRQGTRALFHNEEIAPLGMFQTELSLSWQDKC
jgi:hypothetical protein